MNKTSKTPLVFFNASVILAGLASPRGGSAKLLRLVREQKIRGVISEVILDEVVRRSERVNIEKAIAADKIAAVFYQILPAPSIRLVSQFNQIVTDPGDAHVLASTFQAKATVLVTLDRKHLLSLAKSVRTFRILSPKQLIERLSKSRQ